jgi:transcriptional regulator with XRE-family HTH domain
VNAFSQLWKKLAKSKKYREEFVATQVKRGIPFQIRALLKKRGLSQDELALRGRVTQGVVSRAANPDYGNLTLNTIVRIAAGFDVAFIGKFVPFSELGKWFTDLSEDSLDLKSFEEEDAELQQEEGQLLSNGGLEKNADSQGGGQEITSGNALPLWEPKRKEPDFETRQPQTPPGRGLLAA